MNALSAQVDQLKLDVKTIPKVHGSLQALPPIASSEGRRGTQVGFYALVDHQHPKQEVYESGIVASDAEPKFVSDTSAGPGASDKYSREDHVHNIDYLSMQRWVNAVMHDHLLAPNPSWGLVQTKNAIKNLVPEAAFDPTLGDQTHKTANYLLRQRMEEVIQEAHSDEGIHGAPFVLRRLIVNLFRMVVK